MTGPTLTLPAEDPAADDPSLDVRPGHRLSDRPDTSSRRLHPLAGMALAFAGYLVLSVVLWWQVWSNHPTSTATCGCGDTSLFLWFLEWPAYAIAHGHNLFFSTALFHPGGIDLLSNTSVLAIGVPLAPITWLWGPVAALNLALTLTPAVSGLAMYWLLRRWVRWAPAAFIGGLVFGFSPFVITNLASAHLMTAALALLPLMVACLDELLVRQRHRPATVGLVLGLLLAVQFFVGTEVLAMVVVMGVVAVVLVGAYGAVGHRDELVARAPHAALGLGVTALVAALLLAYPLWVALAGPAHLSGLVWPTHPAWKGGIRLHAAWRVTYNNPAPVRWLSGYQGPALPTGDYLGLGVLAVLVCGVVGFRRDRRLWSFGAVGLVAALLALGSQSYWTPWRVIARVPVLQNVIPGRMMAVVTLCVAVMLGVIVDRTRSTVLSVSGGPDARETPSRRARHRAGARATGATNGVGSLAARLAGAVVALGVAAVAVVPMASAVASNVPLTARPITTPPWFATAGATLPPNQVLLTFPLPAVGGDSMAWQAMAGLPYAMATGSGPGSVIARAGPERAGEEVLLSGSPLLGSPPVLTRARVEAVRQALAGWGVTVVAVPEASYLVAPYNQPPQIAWAVALFTEAVGRTPEYRGGTWIWRHVTSPGALRSTHGTGAAPITK